MPATVEIYTRPGCGYCSAAKSLLTRKSAAFTEYNVAIDPNRRGEMITRAGGGSTYPQIFIDAVHVGGCDDLHALERAGRLDILLAGKDPAP
jgi:glutaredoxin 3